MRDYVQQTVWALVGVAVLMALAVAARAEEAAADPRLKPETVAEQIVADMAVLAVREVQAGRPFAPASFGGVGIYAVAEGRAPVGGSIERRSHLELHGPKYAVGAVVAALGTGALAWLNNSSVMGSPHYGRGTEDQQQQAENRTSAVTVEASDEGEGGVDVDVTINQGGGK